MIYLIFILFPCTTRRIPRDSVHFPGHPPGLQGLVWLTGRGLGTVALPWPVWRSGAPGGGRRGLRNLLSRPKHQNISKQYKPIILWKQTNKITRGDGFYFHHLPPTEPHLATSHWKIHEVRPRSQGYVPWLGLRGTSNPWNPSWCFIHFI